LDLRWGGFLIAVAGVAHNVLRLNALSFLVVLWVIVRWKRPRTAERLASRKH